MRSDDATTRERLAELEAIARSEEFGTDNTGREWVRGPDGAWWYIAGVQGLLLETLARIATLAAEVERVKGEREQQALKGDLLDELALRGWMLMDLSNSTIVRPVAGDPRKPNREATGPNWRVRRNNGYYSYGDTPEMAILAGIADEDNESTPRSATHE